MLSRVDEPVDRCRLVSEGKLRPCCLRGAAGSVGLAAQPLSISGSGSLKLGTSALPRRSIGGVFPTCWHRSSRMVFFRYFGRPGRQLPWHCSFFDHALVQLAALTVLLLNALLAYQHHLMLGAADFHGVTVGDIEKRGNGLMTQIGPDRVRRSMIRS